MSNEQQARDELEALVRELRRTQLLSSYGPGSPYPDRKDPEPARRVHDALMAVHRELGVHVQYGIHEFKPLEVLSDSALWAMLNNFIRTLGPYSDMLLEDRYECAYVFKNRMQVNTMLESQGVAYGITAGGKGIKVHINDSTYTDAESMLSLLHNDSPAVKLFYATAAKLKKVSGFGNPIQTSPTFFGWKNGISLEFTDEARVLMLAGDRRINITVQTDLGEVLDALGKKPLDYEEDEKPESTPGLDTMPEGGREVRVWTVVGNGYYFCQYGPRGSEPTKFRVKKTTAPAWMKEEASDLPRKQSRNGGMVKMGVIKMSEAAIEQLRNLS